MNKILKSKKAVSAKVGYWIFILLFLLPLMIFSIFQVINTFSAQVIKTNNLENILIKDRILNAVSFTDPNTGRNYPGTIYLPHFNEFFIKESLKTKRQFGVELTLNNTQPIYFNEDFYEIAYPLSNTNKYREIKENLYVLINDGNGNTVPSHLELSIVHYRENE